MNKVPDTVDNYLAGHEHPSQLKTSRQPVADYKRNDAYGNSPRNCLDNRSAGTFFHKGRNF